jgi:hypothetical protein
MGNLEQAFYVYHLFRESFIIIFPPAKTCQLYLVCFCLSIWNNYRKILYQNSQLFNVTEGTSVIDLTRTSNSKEMPWVRSSYVGRLKADTMRDPDNNLHKILWLSQSVHCSFQQGWSVVYFLNFILNFSFIPLFIYVSINFPAGCIVVTSLEIMSRNLIWSLGLVFNYGDMKLCVSVNSSCWYRGIRGRSMSFTPELGGRRDITTKHDILCI